MNGTFLSVEELAEALNVPKSWVYSRTRESGPGSIPKIKCGKYLRFQFSEVVDWLKEMNQRESEL